MNHYQYLTSLNNGKRLSDYDNLSAFIVDVSPELAQKLLALNFEHNRELRNSSVKRFRNALETGEFFDGSPIRLTASEGRYTLTDGQHRLAAIIASGINATLTVIVCEHMSAGDVRRDYALLDSFGIKRSQADVVAALDSAGEFSEVGGLLTVYAAAARVIKSNFASGGSDMDYSRLDLYPLLREFSGAVELTRAWFQQGRVNSTRGFMRAGVLAIALVTARYADEARAADFWRGAYEDDGLRKHDPRKRLNEYLREPQRGGGSRQMLAAAVAAKCWNTWISGGKIVQLKMPASVPPIALTPYPVKSNGSGAHAPAEHAPAYPAKLI